MSPQEKLERAVSFDMGNGITINKCMGHRLPKQPMWKVVEFGATLNKYGDWEHEPIPSSRDDEYYRLNRYDTFEEAEQALCECRSKNGRPA